MIKKIFYGLLFFYLFFAIYGWFFVTRLRFNMWYIEPVPGLDVWTTNLIFNFIDGIGILIVQIQELLIFIFG